MRIRKPADLIDTSLLPGISFVVQVEPGDSVDLVVGLVARLIGEAECLTEQTIEHETHFVIHVQPQGEREAFCILVAKQAGLDSRLLALCTMYSSQS